MSKPLEISTGAVLGGEVSSCDRRMNASRWDEEGTGKLSPGPLDPSILNDEAGCVPRSRLVLNDRSREPEISSRRWMIWQKNMEFIGRSNSMHHYI